MFSINHIVKISKQNSSVKLNRSYQALLWGKFLTISQVPTLKARSLSKLKCQAQISCLRGKQSSLNPRPHLPAPSTGASGLVLIQTVHGESGRAPGSRLRPQTSCPAGASGLGGRRPQGPVPGSNGGIAAPNRGLRERGGRLTLTLIS